MSYRPSITNKVNIEATSLKTVHNASGVSTVPEQIAFEAGVTLTGVSVVSGRFRLTSGASYYIEASSPVIGINRPASGVFESALYNTTTSAEIGQRFVINLPSTQRTDLSPRSTRWAARALILASDFGANSTMDIEFRVVACSPATGTVWYSSYEQPGGIEGTGQVTIWRIP